MENHCALSNDQKCILWLDYEIARQELEECHTLCHGNWIEIERKYKYIQELKHRKCSIASTFCNQLSSAIIVSYYTQSKKFSA